MSIGGIFEERGAVLSLHLDFAADEEGVVVTLVVEVVAEVDAEVETDVVVVGVDEAEDCNNILMIPSLGLLLVGVVSGALIFGTFSLSIIFVDFVSPSESSIIKSEIKLFQTQSLKPFHPEFHAKLWKFRQV